MGFAYASANIQRERNLAGGIAADDPLQILSPEVIAGSSVTVTWDQGNQVADTFEVRIGTTPDGNSVGSSGILSLTGAEHEYTFNNLSYQTNTAYITVRYRLGQNAAFRAVSRLVPVAVAPVISDPIAANNWDDDGFWDDSKVWVE